MNLKEYRRSKEKTSQELAENLGVSVDYYRKVERGDRNPSFAFMKRLKIYDPMVNIDNIFFSLPGNSADATE
jgi:putative transcriptional regulator